MMLGMRLVMFVAIVGVVLGKSANNKEKADADPETKIVFVIEEELKSHNQILKLKLEVTQRDASLVDAIQKANLLRQQLETIFEQFCVRVGQECPDNVETSQYNIQAQYYHLRGQQVFKTFLITFQIDFIFSKFEFVGLLLEDFQDIIIDNNIVIRGIEWEDISQEANIQEIVDQGMERARRSCEGLGMTLGRILEVEQVEEEEEEEEKEVKKKEEDQGEQEEEEQEEEQEQPAAPEQEIQKYKFVAICKNPKPPKKSPKPSSANPSPKKLKQK